MQRRHALHCLLAGLALLSSLAGQASEPPVQEVNLANQAELEMLAGVGPTLSTLLLAERQRAGPFRSWRDLVARVKGLGPAKARALSAAGLRVDGQAWPG